VQDIEIGNTVNPKDDSFAIDQLAKGSALDIPGA
jgi:hypothetical protein